MIPHAHLKYHINQPSHNSLFYHDLVWPFPSKHFRTGGIKECGQQLLALFKDMIRATMHMYSWHLDSRIERRRFYMQHGSRHENTETQSRCCCCCSGIILESMQNIRNDTGPFRKPKNANEGSPIGVIQLVLNYFPCFVRIGVGPAEVRACTLKYGEDTWAWC
ncbi:hypothetical protein ACMFMF_011910 [Clarireedia jacksonii]